MQQHKVQMGQRQFRIGDLANELKVKKFVIRFWEQEFELSSDRSDGGHRFYTDKDLRTFRVIKDLLYNQGYTIEGARKQLPVVLKADAEREAQQVEAAVVAAQASVVMELASVASAPAVVGAAPLVSVAEQSLLLATPTQDFQPAIEEHAIGHAVPSHQPHEHVKPATMVPCSACEKRSGQIGFVKEQLLELKERLERI